MRAFDQPAVVLAIETEDERVRVRGALSVAISCIEQRQQNGADEKAREAVRVLEDMFNRLERKSWKTS